MFDVRRVVASRFLASAGAGAIVAVLAAAHAYAQPMTRPVLRPALEDNDEPRRETPRRPARRSETRPAGALPNFDNPETSQLPSFGNPAGSGASRTGFNSLNTRRRPATTATQKKPQSGLIAAPLPLTAPGTSPTSTLLRNTAAGTSARPATTSTGSTGSATSAAVRPPSAAPATAAVPRNTLVRLPDGTPNGVAGTVSTSHLTTGSATLLRRRTAAEEDAFAQLGVHAGAFLVLPAVEVTGGFDTNPARVPGGRSSSLITVSPELLARSDWQRHEVTATLRGGYTAYANTPELDRPNFDGKVTGRLDVTRDTALIGEGTFLVGTDNPGSPNVQAGLSRFPIYTTLGGTLGVTQRFNRVEVTAKGTAERTEFQDSVFTDGTSASNSDRDFNRYAGSLRTSYDLMPGLKPFVEVSADTREHDLQVDRFGLQRDSTGWTAKAGTTFQYSRKLTGEIALGWIEREYKDPSLQKLQGFLFDASLIYSMSALTNVKLTAATTAGETTVPGTAGILTRNAGIEVEHSFRRWLVGAAKFNYGYDDYVGSARKDDRYSISGALTYKLNRVASVKGEIRQEWLNSTIPGVDYTASVFLLGMRLQR